MNNEYILINIINDCTIEIKIDDYIFISNFNFIYTMVIKLTSSFMNSRDYKAIIHDNNNLNNLNIFYNSTYHKSKVIISTNDNVVIATLKEEATNELINKLIELTRWYNNELRLY